jgi:hypothetical protein
MRVGCHVDPPSSEHGIKISPEYPDSSRTDPHCGKLSAVDPVADCLLIQLQPTSPKPSATRSTSSGPRRPPSRSANTICVASSKQYSPPPRIRTRPTGRELLQAAVDQIELLGWTLIDILSSPGEIDQLNDKLAAGCRLRILVSAPDSSFLRAAAEELGQDEEDYIGRSELQLQVETARGHLERLAGQTGVELREFYADPRYTILRFDEHMLITPHLHGTPPENSPVLYLRRRHNSGLFDRFAAHLDAIATNARPIEPIPSLYPDPNTHPDRYHPLTAQT